MTWSVVDCASINEHNLLQTCCNRLISWRDDWCTVWVDHDRHGSVNIATNQLVTLCWGEIVGGYNTLVTVVQIGPRK